MNKLPGKKLDVEVLLAHAVNLDNSRNLLLHYDQPVDHTQFLVYEQYLTLRAAGQPVALILGHKEFWSLDFIVNHHTLIPRPESELLIEKILYHAADRDAHYNILDLGTGSGCLAISLLKEYQSARGTAVDISPQSLAVAQANAIKHHVFDRLQLLQSNWLQQVPEQLFDIVVANPPYIPLSIVDELSHEVRDFEPIIALTDFADGINHYKQIAAQLIPYLHSKSIIAIEFGQNQQQRISEIFSPLYHVKEMFPDLNDITRGAILSRC